MSGTEHLRHPTKLACMPESLLGNIDLTQQLLLALFRAHAAGAMNLDMFPNNGHCTGHSTHRHLSSPVLHLQEKEIFVPQHDQVMHLFLRLIAASLQVKIAPLQSWSTCLQYLHGHDMPQLWSYMQFLHAPTEALPAVTCSAPQAVLAPEWRGQTLSRQYSHKQSPHAPQQHSHWWKRWYLDPGVLMQIWVCSPLPD